MATIGWSQLVSIKKLFASHQAEFSKMSQSPLIADFQSAQQRAWHRFLAAPVERSDGGVFDRPLESQSRYDLSPSDCARIEGLKASSSAVVVFINGEYSQKHSELGQVQINPLSHLWQESVPLIDRAELKELLAMAELRNDKATALGLSLPKEGYVLCGESASTEDVRPVHVVHFVLDGGASATLNLILLKAKAKACVVESFWGGRSPWVSALTLAKVGESADLEWIRYHGHAEADHLGELLLEQSAGSVVRLFGFSATRRLAKESWSITQTGEGATCEVFGSLLSREKDYCAQQVVIRHAKEKGVSRQIFKSLAAGQSKSFYHGKIHIDPEAQLIDANQSHQGLLFSEGAEVITRPELEVYADNVKANHGATLGQLDQNSLFYLRSRGLPLHQAVEMLAHAFIKGAASSLRHADLQREISNWLRPELSLLSGELSNV